MGVEVEKVEVAVTLFWIYKSLLSLFPMSINLFFPFGFVTFAVFLSDVGAFIIFLIIGCGCISDACIRMG